TETPCPHNITGVKGVGETGTIASSQAVVNAVCDALSPLGIKHIDMPLTPERVWRAIQQARSGSASASNGHSAMGPAQPSQQASQLDQRAGQTDEQSSN
ncbi:MAG TPA: hypothetical protein VF510_09090, partial [Ktedonobacterales bacterium]